MQLDSLSSFTQGAGISAGTARIAGTVGACQEEQSQTLVKSSKNRFYSIISTGEERAELSNLVCTEVAGILKAERRSQVGEQVGAQAESGK